MALKVPERYFRFRRFGDFPNKSQAGAGICRCLLAKDGSVIIDTLLAKNENNKKQERGMRMSENKAQRNDREFAVRKRELCRELLEFLSEIREAKWIAEEKVRKALTDNEEYRWIVIMADTIEDD